MHIVVTGGAGYIGSNVVHAYCDLGYNVTVFDNLAMGRKEFLDSRATFIEVDLLDREKLSDVISQIAPIDTVIHLASWKNANDSVTEVSQYAENISMTINILDAIKLMNIRFIFASTAAVYGNTGMSPVVESSPINPLNPYGQFKFISEKIIETYSSTYDFEYVIYRFFNIVGDSNVGYIPKFPMNFFDILGESLKGNKTIKIYGDKYHTKDGTCVRDYIDMRDLISVILESDSVDSNCIYNVGSNNGYSVKEVIAEFQKQLSREIPIIVCENRKGDIPFSVASHDLLNSSIGWYPKFSLADMVSSVIKLYSLK